MVTTGSATDPFIKMLPHSILDKQNCHNDISVFPGILITK